MSIDTYQHYHENPLSGLLLCSGIDFPEMPLHILWNSRPIKRTLLGNQHSDEKKNDPHGLVYVVKIRNEMAFLSLSRQRLQIEHEDGRLAFVKDTYSATDKRFPRNWRRNLIHERPALGIGKLSR